MSQEVSMSNTKKEILSAYDELFTKLKDQKKEDPRKENEQQIKVQIVKNATDNTFDGIVENIASMKLHMGKVLEKIGSDLEKEFKRLSEIKKAIKIEEENLENVYQLTSETDSLAAMIQAQKEIKESFENELNEQKEKWAKEKNEYINKLNEDKEDKEKLRKREDDEYNYSIEIKRKKEEDIYQEKKAKQEKELADKKVAFESEIKEREQTVAENEAELLELRKNAENFPKELEKAVTSAIKQETDSLNAEFDFKIQLSEKETKGKIDLKDQIISNLEAKILDLQSQIKSLSGKTDKAEANAKDIVMKAIESSGNKQFIVERTSKQEDKE